MLSPSPPPLPLCPPSLPPCAPAPLPPLPLFKCKATPSQSRRSYVSGLSKVHRGGGGGRNIYLHLAGRSGLIGHPPRNVRQSCFYFKCFTSFFFSLRSWFMAEINNVKLETLSGGSIHDALVQITSLWLTKSATEHTH